MPFKHSTMTRLTRKIGATSQKNDRNKEPNETTFVALETKGDGHSQNAMCSQKRGTLMTMLHGRNVRERPK